MTSLASVVRTHGLPMALYTDRAHWAFHTPKAKGPVDKTRADASRARAGAAWASSTFRRTRRRPAGAVNGSIGRSKIGSSMSCASPASPRSRRPIAIWPPRSSRSTTRRSRGRPASRPVPSCRSAPSIWMRFSCHEEDARRRARQHRHLERPGAADRAAAGAPQLRGLHVTVRRHLDGRYTIHRGTHRLGRFCGRRPAYGRCRRRGRQDARPPPLGKRPNRVFHSSHRPRL